MPAFQILKPRNALYGLILLALILLPLPAFAQSNRAAPVGKVLRVAAGITLPAQMDPHRNSWNDEIQVSLLDFEGLTALDEQSQTIPAAAESWEFSDDGLTATFHLRDGLTYSDGSPLTAERFRYAIQRSCDPHTAAPYATILFPIVGCAELNGSLDMAMLSATPAATPAADDLAIYESALAGLGIETPDDQTLVIHLKQPAAYLPTIAATWVFYPVKQEIVEANPDGWWNDPAQRVGNGVFRAAAFDLNEDAPRLSFAANEHYWGGRPKLDGIEFIYGFDTAEEQVEAYRQNEVDIAWTWTEMLPEVEADPTLRDQIVRYQLADTMGLTFNLTREPFQDQKVREAFAYAFDRQKYCDEVWLGTCVPAYSWIPPGVPGAIETDAFAFDLDAARQALADSSYGNAESIPAITYSYVAEWPDAVRDAEWLVAQYQENLGIEITAVPASPDEIFASYASAETWPDLAFWGWTQDYPDPQNWLSITWTCDTTMYPGLMGYCNEKADALIRQADAETDPEQRMALYEEAGHLIVADAPVVFRSNSIYTYLVAPYVTDYVTTSRDFWPGMSSLRTIDLTQETVPASEATPAA